MIYYVEDDENIRELVVYTLTQMSLPCRGFADGAAFRAAVAEAAPDLVLLDIMLPGEDGLSLLRFLRENHRTAETPVIMLTAKGTEMDKVQGLDYGADDYITKPFNPIEVTARVKSQLRRYMRLCGTSDAAVKKSVRGNGRIEMDNVSKAVTLDGEPISLTPTEWHLMECLWEQAPRTGREATEYMAESVGWTRSTTLTMLRRMTECAQHTKRVFLQDAAVAELDLSFTQILRAAF